MTATGGETNGRVTLRDLFNAITEQNKERHAMEMRLTKSIDEIAGCVKTLELGIENNKEEIDRLRARSNLLDVLIGIGAAIGSAIAGFLGTRQ